MYEKSKNCLCFILKHKGHVLTILLGIGMSIILIYCEHWIYALDGLYPVYHLQLYLPSPRDVELMVLYIDAITPDHIISNL